MCDLVHDRIPDDLGLAVWRRGDPLDRSAVDADPVGEIRLLRAAFREGDAFIQTEQGAAAGEPLRCWLIFNHDLEVADALAELRGKLIQSVAHQPREARAAQVRLDHCRGSIPCDPSPLAALAAS